MYETKMKKIVKLEVSIRNIMILFTHVVVASTAFI